MITASLPTANLLTAPRTLGVPADDAPAPLSRPAAGFATDAHALAETVFGRRPSPAERAEIDRFWRTEWSALRISLDDAAHRALAATAVAFGTPVLHGSGPGYALSFHPDAEVVRAVRHALHRPASWTPAVTTTRDRLLALVDTDALHPDAATFTAALDERLADGPVVLTVPASAAVPAHLTTRVDGVATVEIVVPGRDCPSADFLAAALARTDGAFLATTTPYVTCASTGRRGPVLDRVGDVQRELGRMRPGAVVLAHRSDRRARRRQAPLRAAGEG